MGTISYSLPEDVVYSQLPTWQLPSLTHRALKTASFDYLFPQEEVLYGVLLLCPLTFSPGIIEALLSSNIPTIGFFKSFPALQ